MEYGSMSVQNSWLRQDARNLCYYKLWRGAYVRWGRTGRAGNGLGVRRIEIVSSVGIGGPGCSTHICGWEGVILDSGGGCWVSVNTCFRCGARKRRRCFTWCSGARGAPAYDHGAWCRGRRWMIQESGDTQWQGKQARLLSEIE